MPRLSDFLKPKVKLPINFLRTAFQVGTGIYQSDNRLPDTFGAARLAMVGMSVIGQFQSAVLESIETNHYLTASYFQNEHGGIIIHCEYDNSRLSDLHLKSATLLIGHLSPEQESTKNAVHILKPYFIFMGDYKKGVMVSKNILASNSTYPENAEEFLYEDVNVKDHQAVARSICFSDLCFLAVLSGDPVEYNKFCQTVLNYTQEELNAHFMRVVKRSTASLESEVQIVPNVPLKTYDTGPVI